MTRQRLGSGAVAGLFLALAVGALPLAAQSTTRVMIRVTANDAKIIGSGVGGARITILDVETGAVLAEGVQEGGTGDTERIMRTARERGVDIYTSEGAAGLLTDLELHEPTLVEIVAEGPLGTPHAVQRASRTTWLFPGHDVLGDGIVLDLLGFTIELEAPSDEATVHAGQEVAVQANVTMLCGCPTQPGGLWDSDDYTIVARWVRDGEIVGVRHLEYTGSVSTYGTTLVAPEPGPAELQVLAMDAAKGNFGIVRRQIEIAPR